LSVARRNRQIRAFSELLGGAIAVDVNGSPRENGFFRPIPDPFDDKVECTQPEIFRNVGLKASDAASITGTSEAQRRQFEAKIPAGDCVNGAQIISTRAAIGVRTARSARDETANHIGGA
jgi:hypothetical protein